MNNDQRLVMSLLLNDLMSNDKTRDDTINKLIKIIISEAISLERYDIIKKLSENGLI